MVSVFLSICWPVWYIYRVACGLVASFRKITHETGSRLDLNVVTPKDVFPVRVIDITATLKSEGGVCFSQPEDWNFHTISHRWSEMVGRWSNEVGARVRQKETCASAYNRVLRVRVTDAIARLSSVGRLCFSAPNNWNLFCSVFKSWSQMARNAGNCASDYNRVFESADFSGWECYNDFKDFLKLLQADGVNWVWFDALCINQTDTEEKSREISHMGAIYGKSLGCYVLVHGLGKGYGILEWNRRESAEGKDTEIVKSPPWFSRVWTLQEFLLPQKLSFILELPTAMLTIIIVKLAWHHEHNRCWLCPQREEGRGELVLNELSHWVRNKLPMLGFDSEGFADVFNSFNSMKPKPELAYSDIEDFFNRLREQPSTNYKCMQYLRDLKPVSGSPNLYFVNRQGYVYLLFQYEGLVDSRVASREMYNLIGRLQLKTAGTGQIKPMDQWEVLKMAQLLQEKVNREVCLQLIGSTIEEMAETYVEIVKETASRDCAEGHEEDRVLSTMALLGLEGLVAVRAGRSLDEQVLELCQALAKHNPNLLIAVCASFAGPYAAEGLSWAPHFSRDGSDDFSWQRTGWSGRFPLKAQEVEVLGVTPGEGLKLSCRFVRARLQSFKHHFTNSCSDPLQNCNACRTLLQKEMYPLCDWDRASFQDTVLNAPEQQQQQAPYQTYWVLQIDDGGPSYPFFSQHTLQFDRIVSKLSHFPDSVRPPAPLILHLPKVSHTIFEFQTWLLLLAGGNDDPETEPFYVFMVCVGTNQKKLHKIGLLQLGKEFRGPSDFESFQRFSDRLLPKDQFAIGGWKELPLSQCSTLS